jgi:ATP-binding cassette, subfamily B, bacterial CvaB/MchF/RaxB
VPATMWRRRKLPMIYQAESTECALACLAMITGYHGLDISIHEIRERYPISMKGATLRAVVEIASRVGLLSRSVRCDVPALRALALPAMLHWDFEHFVVLREIRGARYTIHDPATGVQYVSAEELSRHFTGVVVLLSPASDFAGGVYGERFSLWRLLKRTRGVVPFIGQVLWLTAFLELFALLTPLFLRSAIDSGLAQGDLGLLGAITLGIALVAVFQGLLLFLRDYVIAYFGASFNLQLMSSLFRHLLSLPMQFFEKHITGDLIDRYQSTNAIRQIFTSSLPSILLDGAVTLASIAIVFLISPVLALISIVGFALYIVTRLRMYRHTRASSERAIRARAEENAHVIDTLRGSRPIKIFAKENERYQVWSNYYARLVNAERAHSVLLSTQLALKVLIVGLDVALSVYFGGRLVAEGTLSLGVLLAFFFYKAHFTSKSTQLAERLLDLRLVGVHLDRLAEIALSEPEPAPDQPVSRSDVSVSTIAFEAVSFRYSPQDPPVLSDATFEIHSGDFVALIGPSGSGKTTIFKLLLGLLPVTSGRIAIAGKPLAELDLKAYRRRFGVVMQDDLLLTGTILDNIAFFEPSPDEVKATRCAKLALIFDEIEAMPMKFNTRIGDLGSALSGGQKQRILLARALYQDPEIILLDEGTANLDEQVEKQLLDNLCALGFTCISIAHRPETIFRANRVLRLEHGTLTEVTHTLEPEARAVSR